MVALSIMLNIGEGCNRKLDIDQIASVEFLFKTIRIFLLTICLYNQRTIGSATVLCYRSINPVPYPSVKHLCEQFR